MAGQAVLPEPPMTHRRRRTILVCWAYAVGPPAPACGYERAFSGCLAADIRKTLMDIKRDRPRKTSHDKA